MMSTKRKMNNPIDHSHDIPQRIRGFDILRASHLNKGLTFTQKERAEKNLRGLLPAGVLSNETQMARSLSQIRKKSTDLERYIYLQTLQDTNETLYYRLLLAHTQELMPFVYTPTVGQACLEFSHIYREIPRGLFISVNDIGHVREMLDNWPVEDIKVIVMTDGERILGLGDLGANGMGISIGKLALYTACAGIHPQNCLPICFDAGTNNEEYLNDPFYIGLHQKRENGERYEQLIDEFMHAATEKYGRNVLIQFEDFGNQNAFTLLKKYQNDYCTFNDDIQGTASVIVAGLLAGVSLCGTPLSKQKFVFLGAGEAGTGIADLIALAIHKEANIKISDARKQIWLVDSQGLVVSSRKEGLQKHKLPYAHEAKECNSLLEAIRMIQPTTLIGVCTRAKTFTKEICEEMAKINKRPIIFALSNPTSKSECTAEEAYSWTNGKCIFASGSPFHPVTLNGQVFVPGQGNNSYIFPGLGLGTLASGCKIITDDVMLIAAKTLASMVNEEDLVKGSLYPPLSKIRQVSLNIATHVANYAYDHGYASHPKPKDVMAQCKSIIYNP